MLTFWFGELGPKQWFVKDEALDSAIRKRFLAAHEMAAAAAALDTCGLTADTETGVAAIIALDQFPRNMFRETPRAFATDGSALALAKALIQRGQDAGLDRWRRLFTYLPFEHSEALADQDRAVQLISLLGDTELTRYAVAHRDIIRRFGRFPHRNVVLDRASTPEEIAFLKEPGSSF